MQGGKPWSVPAKTPTMEPSVDAVHVLFRLQGPDHGLLVKMRRKGPEDQYSVDGAVLVDLVDHLHKLFLAYVGGEHELLHRHAQGIAPLCGAPLIGEVVGPLPHADDAQSGDDSLCLQSLRLSLDLFIERCRYFFSQKLLCHGIPSCYFSLPRTLSKIWSAIFVYFSSMASALLFSSSAYSRFFMDFVLI